MFPDSPPFDYLLHFERHDRVRRMRAQPTESRVRQTEPRQGTQS